MTKTTEYHVFARSTPHAMYTDDKSEIFMGSYPLFADAKRRLQDLRDTIESRGHSPGFEPYFYFIKEVEVVQRGEEEIKGFANLMQKKLYENRHKPGWNEDDIAELFFSLESEVTELRKELFRSDMNIVYVALEAADVANYAMMIADVALDGDWNAV